VKNKRTTERHVLELDAEIRVGDEWQAARTRNASLGGVFIDLRRPVAAGTRVRLRVQLAPGKDVIETDAIVRWQDDAGAGLQFDGLRARDIWLLGKFLEARS
jgi:hypothetical protein